jgi:hypothetical protein
MTKPRTSLVEVLLAAIFAGSGGLGGCASTVAPDDKACPCADGYVCCSSGLCARDEGSCAAASRALAEQARGAWQGYVENHSFASGVDAIQLAFQIRDDGSLGGTVVLGNPETPSAPTDPNRSWPPGQVIRDRDVAPELVEGFAYTARSIVWENRRLRFKLASREAWQAWCGLQRAFWQQSSGGVDNYACIPDAGAGLVNNGQGACMQVVEGEPSVPADCEKRTLCLSDKVCACSSAGCTARAEEDISIDISLRDGRGDGSLSLSRTGTTRSLRLTQDAR